MISNRTELCQVKFTNSDKSFKWKEKITNEEYSKWMKIFNTQDKDAIRLYLNEKPSFTDLTKSDRIQGGIPKK